MYTYRYTYILIYKSTRPVLEILNRHSECLHKHRQHQQPHPAPSLAEQGGGLLERVEIPVRKVDRSGSWAQALGLPSCWRLDTQGPKATAPLQLLVQTVPSLPSPTPTPCRWPGLPWPHGWSPMLLPLETQALSCPGLALGEPLSPCSQATLPARQLLWLDLHKQ